MTDFHDKNYCNKCGLHTNGIEVIDTEDGYVSEVNTECRVCKHKDYWAHGFFESGSWMVSKCKTYHVDT